MNNTVIIIVIVILFFVIMVIACVFIFKKSIVKKPDAYQKWTNFYDSKSKNTEENKDIHHFYSKRGSTPSLNLSPNRLSLPTSRNMIKPQLHDKNPCINHL
jgi:uncharacterized protein YxeA